MDETRPRRTASREREAFTRASAQAPVQTSTRRRERRLAHFHFFYKLPVEIQLMIWSLWREDQPILRHYMSLASSIRVYAALDPVTKTFVHTTASSAGDDEDAPLDPMEYKIRFTNSVVTAEGKCNDPMRVVHPTSSVISSQHYSQSPASLFRLSPAFAWVNFERDVFCIENLGHRYGGRFRFLSRNIGFRVPKPLAADHWASRIQTLAMQTPCETRNHPYRPYGPPEDRDRAATRGLTGWTIWSAHCNPAPIKAIDDQALHIMSSLKCILLVLQRFTLCKLLNHLIEAGKISRGYVDYALIQAVHKPGHALWDGGISCDGDCCSAKIYNPKFISDMRQKLDSMGKQSVEMRLVVDTVNIVWADEEASVDCDNE